MKLKLLLLFFIYLLGFSSCEGKKNVVSEVNQKTNSKIEEEITNSFSNEKDNLIFSIDNSEGTHVCYISKIINTKNDTSILVDFVNYLIGNEAHKASINDGNYEVDNLDTITDITNDYYISNNNKKLRKFKLSKSSIISIYDYETNGEFKRISITNFLNRNKDNVDFYELYNIKFNNGNTLDLEEIFVP